MAREKAMRRVIQQDAAGCGIAVVATIAGRSHEEALDAVKAAFRPRKPKALYTHAKHLKAALRSFKVKTGERLIPSRSRRYSDLEHDTVLKIGRAGDRYWHWVAWDAANKRDIDPGNPPKKRPRCLSFLRVER